jgi:hypothetical protein
MLGAIALSFFIVRLAGFAAQSFGGNTSVFGARPGLGGTCRRGFGEAHARLITIGELDTGRLEGMPQSFDSSLLQFLSSLKPSNSIGRYFGRCGKAANTQSQAGSSHSTLYGQQNHNNITISVDCTD